MATFDVSFIKPKASSSGGGGSGVGVLTDQLTILQNTLALDGNLAPGDYDLLINAATTLANNGGLTSGQRSDLMVKISAWQKDKSQNSLKLNDDLDRMNRTLASEAAEDSIVVGNDPAAYLQGREASYKAKINDLSEIIDRREQAGLDVSEHVQDMNETLKKYQDIVAAKDASAGWAQRNDGKPMPGFAAYVVTNDQGEIVDVTYGKFGDKTGFVETNGMINGFQVYGKVNAKKDGNNVFILGNQRFSGTDSITPDPANPGVFKSSRLIAESQQSGNDAYSVGTSGFLNFEPSQISTQSYIPRNSWFKSSDGTLYQRKENGAYSKYINFKPDGVDLENIMKIPKQLEKSILPYVSETVDNNALTITTQPGGDFSKIVPAGFVGPVDQSQKYSGALDPSIFNSTNFPTEFSNQPVMPKTQTGSGQPVTIKPNQPGLTFDQPAVSQRAPAPTQRSPQNPIQYAKQTIAKAGKAFVDLFS